MQQVATSADIGRLERALERQRRELTVTFGIGIAAFVLIVAVLVT